MLAGSINWSQLEQEATPNIPAGSNISYLISLLYPYIFIIAGLVMLFYIIYAGYQYMFAGGDVKAMETAKKNLTYSIVGFLVIFAAYWVMAAVGNMLGIKQLTNIFK